MPNAPNGHPLLARSERSRERDSALGRIARAISRILCHCDRRQKGSAIRHLLYHRAHDSEQVLRQAFAGALIDDVLLVNATAARFVNLENLLEQGIVAIEYASVIQVLFDPIAQGLEFAEVDHEAALVQRLAAEGERKAPVVPVYLGAVPIVPMLAMGERNIRIRFLAGKHESKALRILLRRRLIANPG